VLNTCNHFIVNYSETFTNTHIFTLLNNKLCNLSSGDSRTTSILYEFPIDRVVSCQLLASTSMPDCACCELVVVLTHLPPTCFTEPSAGRLAICYCPHQFWLHLNHMAQGRISGLLSRRKCLRGSWPAALNVTRHRMSPPLPRSRQIVWAPLWLCMIGGAILEGGFYTAENSELPAGTYIGILTAVGLLVSLLASKVFSLAQCCAMS
jgi:hypothetical protein